MSDWKTIPLGQLVEPVTTWNPLQANPDKTFEYIDLSAINQESKRIVEARKVACGEAPSRARQLVSEGDILVSTVRPNLNGVAKVAVDFKDATASTGFCVLRPRKGVLSSEYLFHWVKSPRFVADMVSKATGASYPAVSDRIILESSLPVPSLSEQCRLAAILDQADTVRVKRVEALKQLDLLAQSIFIDMFSQQNRYPDTALQELCELITDGTHQTPTYAETGTIFLSAKNVTTGYIDWANIKFIPESLHLELHRRLAPKLGDILLAKNGTTGVAALVDRDCIFDIYVSLALLRPGQGVLPAYLLGAINSPICKTQFNESLKGIGVPNLHLKEIRATRIPKPPIQLQEEFSFRMKSVERQKGTMRASLHELDLLIDSLQQLAFDGEI